MGVTAVVQLAAADPGLQFEVQRRQRAVGRGRRAVAGGLQIELQRQLAQAALGLQQPLDGQPVCAGGALARPFVTHHNALDVDLFLPDAPYVIGDADRDAGAAVFSLSRLSHADPEKVKRRTQVETVHGAGHLLGLSHCTDFRCAMFFSRDAADADRKGPGLCASCRAALGLPSR